MRKGMKYKVGDRVRVVSKSPFISDSFLGTIQEISSVINNGYKLKSDIKSWFLWRDEHFEGLADEDGGKKDFDLHLKFNTGDVVRFKDNLFVVNGGKLGIEQSIKDEDITWFYHTTDAKIEKLGSISNLQSEKKKERKLMMTDQEWEGFQKNNNLN